MQSIISKRLLLTQQRKCYHPLSQNKILRCYHHFQFELIHKSSKKGSHARVGRIHTAHGVIDTPNFVAVGTNGSIKGHLMIHPGAEIIKQAGGLHNYIRRDKPIITDSGGFQIFSLATQEYHEEANELMNAEKELKGASKKKHQVVQCDPQHTGEKLGKVLKVTDEGVVFRSYRDGSILVLTPETSVQAQKLLGADIIIPLDELLPMNVSRRKLLESFQRTHIWEKRSLEEHLKNRNNQAMYAVIHGGMDRELRQMSIDTLAAEPFDGFAIGGSLGKDRNELIDILSFITPRVNETGKPNHVLGIGDIESVTRFVSLGVDTFDSAYPTRVGRHGHLFTNNGSDGTFEMISLKQEKYANMFEPLDPTCSCYTCRNYSAAYLHHLFKMYEPTFATLSAVHNLHFMYDMTQKIRQQILNDEI
jgi:queuine tRNA-ribosyltransferase